MVLMGDFNVDLLKYETDINKADLLDQIQTTAVMPQITSPTRTSSRSEILIDNIYRQMLIQT